MKKIILLKLKVLSKMILAKYKPEVVGITGSVGKTSAKEAVYTVLKKKYRTRRNIKNYNNEIGVPLTIIGVESPGKSIFGWIGVLLTATRLVLFRDKDYPEIIVMEMGVDKPGDMKYLNSIVKCKIGVVTLIGPVHLEYFSTIEKIQKEKGLLIEGLPKEGWAILNSDDDMTRQIRERSKARVLTYGLEPKANIFASEVKLANIDREVGAIDEISKLAGISFKLNYQGSRVLVLLPKVIGYNAVYAALVGASVGVTKGMNLTEIVEALKEFQSPKGRMNLIPGIKHTLIIDDTYNSSPQSSIAALDIIKNIPLAKDKRKFVVLGDMLELGSQSEEGHQSVGKHLVKCGIDKLILVGERSRDIGRGAESQGMAKDNIFQFPDALSAGKFVQDRIRRGDLILIKGSQAMRMEKIVLEIMADPIHAKEFLIRQDELWDK